MAELTGFGTIFLETVAAIVALISGAWLIRPAIDEQSLAGGWPFFIKILRISPGLIVSLFGLFLLWQADSTDQWYVRAQSAAAAASLKQKIIDAPVAPIKTAATDSGQLQKTIDKSLPATVPLQIVVSLTPQVKMEGESPARAQVPPSNQVNKRKTKRKPKRR